MHAFTETHVADGQLGKADAVSRAALQDALAGVPISDEQALHLIQLPPGQLPALLAVAGQVRTRRKGRVVTYSPKVFMPVTNLCLDRCDYCGFRRDPGAPGARTMLPDDVRTSASGGRRAGCIEALMCLGDKPERAFRSYRHTLQVLGHSSTISYVEACCEIALEEGLLPHTNAGLMTRDEMRRLRRVNVSLGLMLETVSPRPRRRGGVHHRSPDKDPALRLSMIREAGQLQIPFTTGILLGIGETAAERVVSLRAIGDIHATYGHIQEIIIQNFRAKPATRMTAAAEPESYDVARTAAVARLMLPDMNIQVPPNLNPHDLRLFLSAGINDWGGISPLTLDFVNPEAPWPHIPALQSTCHAAGFALARRLPIYPEFVDSGFVDASLRDRVRAIAGDRGVGRSCRPRCVPSFTTAAP